MTDTRDNHELFPTDNPEFTDGPSRIPRRVDALLGMLLDQFQMVWGMSMGHTAKMKDEDRLHANQHLVDLFGQITLLVVIRELLPADANRIAAGLADQWAGGDSFGEWVHEWRQELNDGKPLTLPISPA